MKHTVRVRMSAAHWDITVYGADPVHINLRTLDAKQQRAAIFEVVKHVRILRDQKEHI